MLVRQREIKGEFLNEVVAEFCRSTKLPPIALLDHSHRLPDDASSYTLSQRKESNAVSTMSHWRATSTVCLWIAERECCVLINRLVIRARCLLLLGKRQRFENEDAVEV